MKRWLTVAMVAMMALASSGFAEEEAPQAVDAKLLARYTGMLDQLRTELTAKIPKGKPSDDAAEKFIAGDAMDAKLAKYVVLLEATPKGLTVFAQQGKEQAALVEKMLSDADLMKQMLVAEGAKEKGGAEIAPP